MYIRTKDGIYEFNKTFNGDSIRIIYGNEIIKQSENLFELIDEFVVNFECFNRSYYFVYENSYDELKRDVQTIQYSAYGAIWTDKGLIFVAKMNDKGELELI